MSERAPDIIDQLAAIAPGSPLDAIRARRHAVRASMRRRAFLRCSSLQISRAFRRSKGLRSRPLSPACMQSRRRANSILRSSLLRGASIAAAVEAEIARGRTQGPYGSYPAGPLSSEDSTGLIYRVSEDGRRVLGARLAAAFEHVHLLVFRPRDSNPAALQALLDAGWSTNDIVTLSQLTLSCPSRFAPSAACGPLPPRPCARPDTEKPHDRRRHHPRGQQGAHQPSRRRNLAGCPGSNRSPNPTSPSAIAPRSSTRRASSHPISACWRAIPTFLKRAPRPTRTSSTTSPMACRARNGSLPPPRRRASMAASIAPRCTRASRRPIRSAARTCSACSTKASVSGSIRDGMR